MEQVEIVARFYNQDFAFIMGGDVVGDDVQMQLKPFHGDIVVANVIDAETGEPELWPFGVEGEEETDKGLRFSGRFAVWGPWLDLYPALKQVFCAGTSGTGNPSPTEAQHDQD